MDDRKRTMWQARMGICDYCGEEMQPVDMLCHIHHCLVYKSELPRSKQDGIDNQINLMLVHPHCHEILQSDRDWCLDFKIAEWGIEAVEEYMRAMKPKTFVGVGR